MRLHHVMLAAVMAASIPAALNAQTTTSSGQSTAQGGTTTDQDRSGAAGSTPSTPSTQGTASDPTPRSGQDPASTTGSGSGRSTGSGGQTTTTTTSSQTTSTNQGTGFLDRAPSHWVASGFVGANYSNNTGTLSTNAGTGNGATSTEGDASADFGFSLGYLWRSVAGAEFLAGFTPNFQVQNGFANINSDSNMPQLNSYMFNAVGAIPLGTDAQWQPFVSGGFGAITLRSDNSGANNNDVTNFFAQDETRAGGNIGVGVMGFAGNWGFRGDVRYFHAFDRGNNGTNNSTTNNGTTGTDTSTNASSSESLPGLNFWRANIGVAFRW